MRKTLYLKFVLGYLIFGFFGFLVVATFVSSMTLEHLKREKADSLYKEATLSQISTLPTYTAACFPRGGQKTAGCTQHLPVLPNLDQLIHRTYYHEQRKHRWMWSMSLAWKILTRPSPPVPFIRLVTFSAASRRKCSVYLRPSLPILKCRAMLSSISPWQIFGLPAKAC